MTDEDYTIEKNYGFPIVIGQIVKTLKTQKLKIGGMFRRRTAFDFCRRRKCVKSKGRNWDW